MLIVDGVSLRTVYTVLDRRHHSTHDIVDAVHRLSAAASDGAADLAALESGEITLADLNGSPGFAPVSEADPKSSEKDFSAIARDVRRAVG